VQGAELLTSYPSLHLTRPRPGRVRGPASFLMPMKTRSRPRAQREPLPPAIRPSGVPFATGAPRGPVCDRCRLCEVCERS
jgi:hypothetical protein